MKSTLLLILTVAILITFVAVGAGLFEMSKSSEISRSGETTTAE